MIYTIDTQNTHDTKLTNKEVFEYIFIPPSEILH